MYYSTESTVLGTSAPMPEVDQPLNLNDPSYIVTNLLLGGYKFETKESLDYALQITLKQIFSGKTNMVWGYTKADIFKIYDDKLAQLEG